MVLQFPPEMSSATSMRFLREIDAATKCDDVDVIRMDTAMSFGAIGESMEILLKCLS